MFRQSVVTPRVKFRIVWLILFKNVVNGGQQHSGNGDDRFLVTSAFFNRKIPIADFGVAFGTNGTKSALNKQRLDVSPRTTDASGFLLSRTLIVLRRKTSPRA